ncbi:MAG: hypothetical protein ABL308_12010 [Oceanicaulis sp.]
MDASALRRRIALSAGLAGAGVIAWRAGEAASGAGPLAFLVSGIGMGVFIVGAILLAGAILQGRASKALDVMTEPASRAVTLRALYGAIGAVLVAGGLSVLGSTTGVLPPAPFDLLLAIGTGAFLFVLAHGQSGLARG